MYGELCSSILNVQLKLFENFIWANLTKKASAKFWKLNRKWDLKISETVSMCWRQPSRFPYFVETTKYSISISISVAYSISVETTLWVQKLSCTQSCHWYLCTNPSFFGDLMSSANFKFTLLKLSRLSKLLQFSLGCFMDYESAPHDWPVR